MAHALQVKFVSKYDERKGKDRAVDVERYIRSSQSPPPARPPAPSARRDGDWDCLSAFVSSRREWGDVRPEMQLDGLRLEERAAAMNCLLKGLLKQGLGSVF